MPRSHIKTASRTTSSTEPLNARDYAKHIAQSIESNKKRASRIALIIPAYNESLVIAHTINSAITAGLNKADIFVVDDSSNDGTSSIVKSILGQQNVMRVKRSGKGLAISKINKALLLTKRYRWIHIADADGEFDTRYFTELRNNLRVENAAATGYVSSLPGGYISKYRTFEYTMGMEVIRRFQSMAKVISIIPGPTSVFRNDVFDQLVFTNQALCEDFDVTLQVHRNHLGSIQFIPSAIARTQDPATYKDFIKQISRWNRGVLQMFFKHKIGLRPSRIDTYLTYQLMQNILFFAMYCMWIPFITLQSNSTEYLALSFMSDVLLVFGFVLFAAGRTKQYDIIAAFPIIYALRWVSLFIFAKSLFEVAILGRYRSASGLWETVARRKQAALSA